MATFTPLLPMVQKYFERDPIQASHSLETLSEEDAVNVLKALPPDLSSTAFPHLSASYAAALLKEVPKELFNQIVERLDPQQGAAIISNIPNEIRIQLLEHLPEKTKGQIRELLTYPEGSAGTIMTTSFIPFRNDLKVKEAIFKIRALAQRRDTAFYTYVVDHDNHLVGIINMRDLMLAQDEEMLEDIMVKDVYCINAFMDREEVAEQLSQRGYFAVPVVDFENKLVGVVKAEHLIHDVQEEATEDIQKMFGAGGNERAFSPVTFSLTKRLPWLHVNLVTAFLAASVVALFEDMIAKITILAVFLPIVPGQAGNSGAQSLAVVMRGLVMREIPAHRAIPLVLKETWLGTITGVIIGVVTGLVAWLWQGNPFLGLVIGLAMVVNLAIAGLAGAGIPLGMKALGLDPAQCSNIILTTITDVMGFFTFLGFAFLFQSYLL